MLTLSDPHRGFKLEGIDAHLSMGLLLTPQEFHAEAMRTRQRPLFDTWAVAAHMPDVLVRMLESDLVPRGTSHGLVTSERGVVYPLVILQAAGLQVRILLSLADSGTQQWFRATCDEGSVTLALEVPETKHLAVVTMPSEVKDRQKVDNIIAGCTQLDSEDALADAARIVRQVGQKSALPSVVRGFPTQEVRLICTLGLGAVAEASVREPEERVLN